MKVREFDVLAWVWGQRKVSQVLGTFGLLDSTMLQPIFAWYSFETYEPCIYLIL
jgi:hypothetical protein